MNEQQQKDQETFIRNLTRLADAYGVISVSTNQQCDTLLIATGMAAARMITEEHGVPLQFENRTVDPSKN